MKKTALYILFSFCVWACRTDYVIDSKQAKKKLVADGLITTLADSSRIILSYTSADYKTGSVEFVNNAAVTVSDGTDIVTFTPTLKKGRYAAYKGYVGKTGKKYRLKIEVDGNVYEADDMLLPVTPIKKLDVLKDEIALPPGADKNFKDYKYLVRYYIDKPPGTNYYKPVVYRNGKLFRQFSRVVVYDDVVLREKDNILPSARYQAGDVARIDLLSLSEKAYKFYSDLNNIQNNDGGIFTPVASNPLSNISNGALGFFQASDVSSMEIKINP